MTRLAWLLCLVACGGRPAPAVNGARYVDIALERREVATTWYRSPTMCGQGPYEIAIPSARTKWDEEVELRLMTPHGVALHAEIVVDGTQVARSEGVFDRVFEHGVVSNAKCLADKRERVQLGRGGSHSGGANGGSTNGAGSSGGASTGSSTGVTTSAELEVVDTRVIDAVSIVKFRLRERADSIVIRFWSIEPNDLTGVLFGIAKSEWRPNVSDAQWEAHVAWQEQERVRIAELNARIAADQAIEREQREAAARAKREAELRIQQEKREAELRIQREKRDAELRIQREKRDAELRIQLELYRELQACRLVVVTARSARCVKLVADDDAKREAARLRAEEAARRRKLQLEIDASTEENRRRYVEAEAARRARALDIAARAAARRDRERLLAAEAEARRLANDPVHVELELRKRERTQYCAAHREDARCWTTADWRVRRAAWDKRIELAQAPAAKPDGPPPAPLAEETPPKLSVNAEWRAGYWHWLDGKWVWLAGMWRVPEADVVAEQTTTAPSAPPPARVETPPPPPVAVAVWTHGFWQWNGTGWVWIAGSYQLRPGAQVTWRATEWRPRGGVHVLVPGAWIRIGGAR